jgi:Tol biopolymer transport system component
VLEQPDSEWPIHWSRDGRFLLYQRSDLKTQFDLWALPMTGADRAPVPVANTSFAERMGEFSPDGRWVVYDTDESGQSDVVVQSFPHAGERLPVSTNGGAQPRFSPDGTEIYFVGLDSKMMAVPVTERGATLELGVPVALFATRNPPGAFKQESAVSGDGRFLINNVGLATTPPPITVILDPKL